MQELGRPHPPLPEGVVVEATAPERLAVVWADVPVTPLLDALVEAGLMAVVLAPEETPDLVAVSGAPALMLVDADLLDEGAVTTLDDVRRQSPHTRITLLAGDGSGSTGLLRALRSGLGEVLDPHDAEAVKHLITTELARGSQERVLAIGAHPDDVEIGCGATLLRHRQQGHPVTVLTLSRGGVGGPAEQRRREAVGAAIEMSAELLMADLPDTHFDEVRDLIPTLEAVIAAVGPTTVYVHTQFDNHQDHRAAHAAAVIAARHVPRVLCYQSPSSRQGFAPTTFVPVDETIEGKVQLLAHYRSQSARSYLEPDMVVATARYWSRQLTGPRYAEPFESVRTTQ